MAATRLRRDSEMEQSDLVGGAADGLDGDSTDFFTLQCVVVSLRASAAVVKFNRAQCTLLLRRLNIIYEMMSRLPNKRPTPQLLSTFRAAEYTVRRMSCGRWRQLLQQLFTCNQIFECLRSRIRSVWSLHSTASWESEDRGALRLDEESNVKLMLQHQAALVPSEFWSFRAASQPAPAQGEPQAKLVVSRSRRRDDGDPNAVDGTSPQDTPSAFDDPRRQSDADERATPPPQLEEPSSVDSDGADKQLESELLHFFRRRFASRWKLSVDELVCEIPGAWLDLPDEAGNVKCPADVYAEDNRYATEVIFSQPDPSLMAQFAPLSGSMTLPALRAAEKTAIPDGSSSAPGNILRDHDHLPPAPECTMTIATEDCESGTGFPSRSTLQANPLECHEMQTMEQGADEDVVVDDEPLFPSSLSPVVTTATQEHLQQQRPTASSDYLPDAKRAVDNSDKPQLAVRFSVHFERLVFRGQQVVVKRLRETSLITAATMEAFVMDVACRTRWSHPNLVTVHGGFCEEFRSSSDGSLVESSDPTGAPIVSLGLVMTDLCTPPERFEVLQRMLFFTGRRFTVHEAIHITLQIADAVQYMLFDHEEVPPCVKDKWLCISPSNIFVLDRAAATQMTDLGQEGGDELPPGRNREEATQQQREGDCVSIAPMDLRKHEEDVGLFDSVSCSNRYAVKFAPPVYLEAGPQMRWAPHPHAASAEVYALTQLFLTLLTNQQPYGSVICQVQLQALFSRLCASDTADERTRGIVIPNTLHAAVQQLCRLGLALRSGPPQQAATTARGALGAAAVASRTPAKGMRLQDFRERLHALDIIARTLPALPSSAVHSTSFVVEPAVDDYGWVLQHAFDHHAA